MCCYVPANLNGASRHATHTVAVVDPAAALPMPTEHAPRRDSILPDNMRLRGAGRPLTLRDQALCGAGAGFAGSFIVCPTEHIKCRLQAISRTHPPVGHFQHVTTGTTCSADGEMEQTVLPLGICRSVNYQQSQLTIAVHLLLLLAQRSAKVRANSVLAG